MSVLSGERLVAARSALDVTQETLAAHSGISQGLISQWERDLKTPPEHSARKIQETLAKLKMIQQRHPGVKIAMNDIRFIRKELRKLDGGSKEIPQVNGALFIREFCKLTGPSGLLPEEFVASAQLAPHIINAPIVSRDGQDMIRLWASEMEYVLDHKPFTEFIALHGGDRRKALTILANESFARLLADVGRERVLALMAALLKTGELKAGSDAAAGKN